MPFHEIFSLLFAAANPGNEARATADSGSHQGLPLMEVIDSHHWRVFPLIALAGFVRPFLCLIIFMQQCPQGVE
jgi:hypothetical protein